jgi:hypothetical protein
MAAAPGMVRSRQATDDTGTAEAPVKLLFAYFLGLYTALLLRVIWGEVFRASGQGLCNDSRWLPYEDEEGFGYREWRCQQPAGHSGQHSGWLRDSGGQGES